MSLISVSVSCVSTTNLQQIIIIRSFNEHRLTFKLISDCDCCEIVSSISRFKNRNLIEQRVMMTIYHQEMMVETWISQLS